MEETKKTIELRPYSMKEIYNLYGISWYVFKTLLKEFEQELGPLNGKYYTVNQVQLIFKKIGIPKNLSLE